MSNVERIEDPTYAMAQKIPVIAEKCDYDTMNRIRQISYEPYLHISLCEDGTYTVRWTIIDIDNPDTLRMTGKALSDDTPLAGVQNAWISPSGRIHYVLYHGHELFAQLYHDQDVDKLEQRGWCHFSYGTVHNFYGRDKFTSDQCFMIALLYDANGFTASAEYWMNKAGEA